MPTSDFAVFPSCCVFVPIYKTKWNEAEYASVRRCMRILKEYDFVIVYKETLHRDDVAKPYLNELSLVKSWRLLTLSDEFFESTQAYNRLMTSAFFYDLFDQWDYLLVYQHDAWILSGNLESWLEKCYSYVGAPWCPDLGEDPVWTTVPAVGNGGLSLRKIKDMKAIISSVKFRYKPILSVLEIVSRASLLSGYGQRSVVNKVFDFFKRLFRLSSLLFFYPVGYQNNLAFLVAKGVNEDIILGFYAKKIFKWLHIPSPQEAASFSLETNPRQVAATFCEGIPFGCHAWEKYDKDFFMSHYSQCFEDCLYPRA